MGIQARAWVGISELKVYTHLQGTGSKCLMMSQLIANLNELVKAFLLLQEVE